MKSLMVSFIVLAFTQTVFAGQNWQDCRDNLNNKTLSENRDAVAAFQRSVSDAGFSSFTLKGAAIQSCQVKGTGYLDGKERIECVGIAAYNIVQNVRGGVVCAVTIDSFSSCNVAKIDDCKFGVKSVPVNVSL